MHPRQALPEPLARLITAQHGVVTREQGLTFVSRNVWRRLISDWVPLARGLHLARPVTFHAAVWAGILRGGDSAVISAEAALYLAGALRDIPTRVGVWCESQPINLEVGEWSVKFHRGSRLGRGEPTRSSVEQALLDLSDTSDEVTTVAAVASALSRRRTTARRLRHELHARQRVRHRQTLTELTSAAVRGIESALEWRFRQRVLRPHGLPEPDRQVRLSGGRADSFYEGFGLIVELDGMRDHADWSKDMMRDNRHLLSYGALTLRYGWQAVEHQNCVAAQQLGFALRSRGWSGNNHACRDCRRSIYL